MAIEGSCYRNCSSEMWVGDFIFRVMMKDSGFDVTQDRVRLAIERGALVGYWSWNERMYWLHPDSVNRYLRTALRFKRWEEGKKEGA